MKPTKLLLLLFSIAIITSYGCSNDNLAGQDPEVKPPSPAAFDALKASALKNRTQTKQFNVEEGVTFTSDKGVVLRIAAGCLTSNGVPATGSADLEYVELFNRENMLVTNKPVMGLTPTGDKKMLVSGGEFFVNATQNGESLEASCSPSLKIPAGLTGGVDTSMVLWNGTIDAKGDLTWDEVKADASGNGRLFFDKELYQAFTDGFGWTNVDRFYSDPRPKTKLEVLPPEGYDAENSAVYLTYDGEPNALAKLDKFEEGTGSFENKGVFSEHYGQVPIGLEMHIIFATQDNGQWRYAIKGVTVADNDKYTVTINETTVGSEQELVDAISALP